MENSKIRVFPSDEQTYPVDRNQNTQCQMKCNRIKRLFSEEYLQHLPFQVE